MSNVTKMRDGPSKVFWTGTLPEKDDFGDEYVSVMIDGKTRMGPWANMTPRSWRMHGIGKYGTGLGQRYVKTHDGRWMKVEG